jgi:hypothetical protein
MPGCEWLVRGCNFQVAVRIERLRVEIQGGKILGMRRRVGWGLGISTPKPGLIRHILALLCSTGFLAVVPSALYAGLIVWSNDLGGPLNLIIIPAVSAVIGFGVSLVVFLPLSLLAERAGCHRWLQILGGFSGVLTTVVVLAWTALIAVKPKNQSLLLFSVAASLSLYLFGGFLVYLCSLAVGRKVFPSRGSVPVPD